MAKANLKVIKGDQSEVAALEWQKRADAEIGRHYVTTGELLREARDGQYYRHLKDPAGNPYATLEEYTAHRYAIKARQCTDMIRAAIAYRALEKSGRDIVSTRLPENQRQMLALLRAAKFEYEDQPQAEVDGRTGGASKVPVALKNTEELANEWKIVNEQFQKKVEAYKEQAAKAEKNGERKPLRPKMSATFVNNNLARKYQKVNPSTKPINFLVRLINRFEQTRDDMETNGLFKSRDLHNLITNEKYPFPEWQFKALEKEVERMRDSLDKFLGMLDQYEYVDQGEE